MRFWRRFAKQSLTVKLIVAISTVVCLVVGIGTVVLMNVTRRGIAETSMTTALYQTQFLKNKLVESMLAEYPKHENWEPLLQDLKKSPGLNEVNIFNREGKISFSTVQSNVGKNVDLKSIKADRFTADEALVEFKNASGRLRIIHPIRSIFQCMTCHVGERHHVLGGIELFVPLKPIYDRFAMSNLSLTFLAVLFIVLIAFLIRWLVKRIVERPIHQLMNTMERARQGELGVRVNIREDPKLRRLAKNFNAMVRGIQTAQERIEVQHRRELAQANRLASLGQYISNISHEIKNPLAAISSALHVLKDEFQAAEKQEIYQELTVQLLRIERTVNNLLRYARQAPPSFEPCDITEPIEQALHSAGHRFRDSKIKVKIDSEEKNQIVEADEGQLEQIFLNLFLNAADAMPNGGLLNVKIRPAAESGFSNHQDRATRVVVEVEDTGKGIEAENLGKIFQPFFSTKKGGTGLGLSVVKGIVEAHGGTIHLESKVCKGTKVILFFPYERSRKELVPA